MQSRERVVRALRFQRPDRAPRDLWLLPGVRMHREAEVDQVLARFPVDIGGPDATYGRGERARGTPNVVGCYTDEWGSVWEVKEEGVVGEVKGPPLAEWSALASYRLPWEVLDQADLFVLPCVESPDGDKDGLPTVLREAMAAGVLVASTSLSSIPDLIKDGENGWLAKPGEVESLVQVLKGILKLPQAQLWDIRKRAQKTIQRSFDVHATIEPLLEVWKKN